MIEFLQLLNFTIFGNYVDCIKEMQTNYTTKGANKWVFEILEIMYKCRPFPYFLPKWLDISYLFW